MNAHFPPAWPPCYPPHRAVSAEEAASIDRRATSEYGLPSLVLMEHASRGVARVASELAGPGGAILVLCGPGNNGGDGYGAARFLHSWGGAPQVLRCAPRKPSAGDARVQFEVLSAALPILDAWTHPDRVRRALQARPAVVVDALFGVGLARALAPPFLDWVREVNASAALCLAVDVPSGMDADTGEGLPECVKADVTATMAAPKRGFAAGARAVGRVVEIDIGLPGPLHAEFALPPEA